MTNTVIIGGHGQVALLLAPLLVQNGHQVTSIVRNPEHQADVAATGATPLVADVERLDGSGIADLLRGSDAVVWSAGAGGGDPARTQAVDRDAAIRAAYASGEFSQAAIARHFSVHYSTVCRIVRQGDGRDSRPGTKCQDSRSDPT